LLSLLMDGVGKTDSHIQVDAGSALAQLLRLDAAKMEFLNVPHSLGCVFSMLRSHHLRVKRVACRILHTLSALDAANGQVV
jgi:hypothetical protein